MNTINGSVGFQFLVTLLLLSAFLVGSSLILRATDRYEIRSSREFLLQKKLEKSVRDTIALLKEDNTPEADSPSDITLISAQLPESPSISIEDISSKLNPNLLSQMVLKAPSFNTFLATSPDSFISARKSAGLSSTIESYKNCVSALGYAQSSCFTRANVNTDDPESLKELYFMMTGDQAGAATFFDQISKAQKTSKVLSFTTLKMILGNNFTKVTPLLSVDACFNIHFMDETILKAIVKIPIFAIKNPEEGAKKLLAERENRELSIVEMASLLGTTQTNLIFQFIGVKTWFYKITATKDKRTCSYIVAVYPQKEDGTATSARRLCIVDTRYFHEWDN